MLSLRRAREMAVLFYALQSYKRVDFFNFVFLFYLGTMAVLKRDLQ